MSHIAQHNHHGPLDTQSQQSSLDSPTIGRAQHSYTLASNSSSIQSSSSSSSLSDTNGSGSHRSQRKAATPSPLQTSTTAASSQNTSVPARTTFVKPGEILSSPTLTTVPPSPNVDKPQRAPKDRLNDLLASERSFYRLEEDIPVNLAKANDSRVESSINVHNDSPRSASDSLVMSKTRGESSTTIARAVPPMSNASQSWTDRNQPPQRNASIDSAMSSVSAGNHSQKSSNEAPVAEADIAKLIQAAGSSETVIKYLLKEKHSLGTQNTQLWRLVDKQRAMILGLNKDLERALKDKERYRKKLKDTLATTAPGFNQSTNSNTAGESSPESRTESQQGVHVESLPQSEMRETKTSHDEQHPSPVDVALAPYPITPPIAGQIAPQPLANITEAEHKMPTSSEHAFQQYDHEALVPDPAALERRPSIVDSVKYNASVPPSRGLPADPPVSRSGGLSAASTMQSSKLATIEGSPNVASELSIFPPPPSSSRKGPPTPLNLGIGKSFNTSSHLHQADTADDDDSDYDDVLEVDEIPTVTERGRRKTREEDDRLREVAAQKDAELRSLSKKSKSRPTTPKEKTPTLDPAAAMPPAVRTIGISPPPAQSDHLAAPGAMAASLAGMLTMTGSDALSEPTIRHLVSPGPMSPGLPLSPRPQHNAMSTPLPRNPRDGSGHSSLTSPPLSPRGMGAFPSMPLSPRAPRQPIPLPPNTPMSMASPGLPRHPALDLVSPIPLQIKKQAPETKEPASGPESPDENSIFRGFVTDEFPDLLLPPNALPSIDVRVASSRLKPSRASLISPTKLDEDPVFTLAIFSRSDGRELWRIEKDSASLTALDQQLKLCQTFTAKTPDRSLFSGHAPAKIDARRIALDKYLEEMLNTPFDLQSAQELCKFLSTNAMEPSSDDSTHSTDSRGESPVLGPGGRPLKNGYLTKRGKNFGGWKARFFVLDGPIFKYYEAPGGAHLGSIKLPKAEIGKQAEKATSTTDPDEADNQYRHAFLIMEPKKKDSSSKVRHVLCAESDKERDQWVEALLRYVDYLSDEDGEDTHDVSHSRKTSVESSHTTGAQAKKKLHGNGRIGNVPEIEEEDDLKGFSYESTAQGHLPRGVRSDSARGTPSPPSYGHEKDPMSLAGQSAKPISGPKNAVLISDSGAWGNRPSPQGLAPADEKKQRKRSFFGFGSKPRPSTDAELTNDSTSSLTQLSYEQHGPIRPAFGAPLAEAVRFNHPADVDVPLPAVVYRCIEYLDAKNAAGEEGIFRLSGSNVVIKQLRERFNVEGDVNLITDEQYYDIHAVASLLKLYLRELPTTILTRELHLDFVAVTELHDTQEKVNALNTLVHRLPKCNLMLLRYLSGFLINIINHAETNKMTVRNVGIVFSPTLNIPAPVFALCLQQFPGIFEAEPQASPYQSSVEVTITAPPLTPDDIRSPRRQHFQELPTPSYNQTSFPRGPHSAFPLSTQQYQQQMTHDTGFSPLQPTYETAVPTMGGPEYGSRSQTIAGPSYDQYTGGPPAGTSSKSKRRESSMFSMGMGASKKPTFNKLKDDSRLVEDESFFD